MSQIQFNPQLYRGKSQVYLKVPGYQGICHIWEWSLEKQKYEKRTSGLKYCAYKKISGIQKTKFFDSFEQAKNWRESPFLFESTQAEKRLTFKEVMVRFFEHRKSKWRVTSYETYEANSKHLAFFHDLPMVQVTPKAVDAWLQFIKRAEYLSAQHHTRLTYKHELSLLRQVCVYYSEYLDDSYQVPCKKRHHEDSIVDPVRYEQVKSDRKFKFIPRVDSERFLSELCKRADKKPRLKAVSIMALFQFFRKVWDDNPVAVVIAIVAGLVLYVSEKGKESPILFPILCFLAVMVAICMNHLFNLFGKLWKNEVTIPLKNWERKMFRKFKNRFYPS